MRNKFITYNENNDLNQLGSLFDTDVVYFDFDENTQFSGICYLESGTSYWVF